MVGSCERATRREISWLAEWLLAAQKELCSLELVNFIQQNLLEKLIAEKFTPLMKHGGWLSRSKDAAKGSYTEGVQSTLWRLVSLRSI